MATQISIQKVVAPNSWLVLGAPDATSVVLLNDTTVNYPDGTADTLPANTEASLVGGGTAFDREADVWVLFCYKGDGVLRAQKESLLYLMTQDYAPLGRVLHDKVVPYQPVPFGGGASIKTGSWSGGAVIAAGRAISGGGYYGVFDAQSIQGGGSVSGVSINLSEDNDSPSSTTFGFYVKVATFPGSDTTLLDLHAGTNGYIRVKLTSAGHIWLETSLGGTEYNGTYHRWTSFDLTPTSGIATGTWYWVSGYVTNSADTRAFFDDTHNSYQAGGQVTGPGGVTDGAQAAAGHVGGLHGSFTATLGWGVTESSSYAPFPRSTGDEMSKLMLRVTGSRNTGLFAAPTSDPSTSGLEALYLCRQPVGVVTGTLTDSTSNAFNLTPGPNGLAIVADGPYG